MIIIKSPRYRDRTVLLARYKLSCGQDVKVKITEGTYKGVYKVSITAQKETLWKRFCQDVCEKMVAYYYEDSIDIIHFHKIFNEKFNEVAKYWKEENNE